MRSLTWGVTSRSANVREAEERGEAKPWAHGADKSRRSDVIKEVGDFMVFV